MAAPPLAGTDQVTVALASPAVAVATGALGLVAGVRPDTVAAALAVSFAFDAVTLTE
jgi:hypothetical protein